MHAISSCSYIDFDIFVSHKEQFCNGTETLTDTLTNGVYFQYKTNNRAWITVDIYNGIAISNFACYYVIVFVIYNMGSNRKHRRCTRISVK